MLEGKKRKDLYVEELQTVLKVSLNNFFIYNSTDNYKIVSFTLPITTSLVSIARLRLLQPVVTLLPPAAADSGCTRLIVNGNDAIVCVTVMC